MQEIYRKGIAIIILDKDKVLVVHNKKWPLDLWKFPQGRINGNDTKEKCVQNIIKRELGNEIKVKLLHETSVIHKYKWPEKINGITGQEISFVIAKYLSGKIKPNTQYVQHYKWIELNEIFNFLYEDYKNGVIETLTGADVINEDIKSINDLKKIGFKIIEVNRTNNSVRGIVSKKGEKYFLKKTDDFISEIIGYILIKESYPTPKIKTIFLSSKILLFEYHDKLYTQKSTLHLQRRNDLNSKKIKNLFKYYKNSSKSLLRRNHFPVDLFFRRRINQRIKPWYLQKNNELFNKKMIINGVKLGNMLDIVLKVVDYFEDKERYYTCLLSQGDPTDVNMSLEPLFLDTNTAGYNPIISEISIFVWCHLIAGNYFYPKYHPEAYFKKTQLDNPVCQYKIKNDEIYVKLEQSLDEKDIFLIKNFLSAFPLSKIRSELESDFKYFLIMRILSTLNVTKMSKKDMIISMALANIFWEKDRKAFKYLYLLLDNGGLK